MIPRIGARGHSFRGAGQYFLHDKKADTKERVAWTYTHNLPTENPELAMKIMAYTAINRNKLKQEMGVPLTGRKGLNQPVYTFSLGWSPDQEPEANHMRDKALGALELLGLKSHEAVLVAHNDTAHPHVHCVVNLVNPQNGKTLRPQNDRLKLSTWAEAYEKEHGKIYCEQRVINNEERRQGKKVKHRSDKVEKAATIQNLYAQAKDAQGFQEALEANGYTLATGDRRGFVLVDKEGKISSLSRQLKGQRAKDIRERLANLWDLPQAQTLSDERQYFFRDQYETERQKRIVDAAIEEEEKRQQEPRQKQKKNPRYLVPLEESFAQELDAKRAAEQPEHLEKLRKEWKFRDFYKREEYVRKIYELKISIKAAKNLEDKERLKSDLNDLERSLADVDNRMEEQGVSPEMGYAIKDKEKGPENKSQTPDPSKENETQRKREEFRQQLRKNKTLGNDRNLGQ